VLAIFWMEILLLLHGNQVRSVLWVEGAKGVLKSIVSLSHKQATCLHIDALRRIVYLLRKECCLGACVRVRVRMEDRHRGCVGYTQCVPIHEAQHDCMVAWLHGGAERALP